MPAAERAARAAVAVVGSGPAGMYVTGFLLRQRPGAVAVDVYERLPTPWGLVRFGVAPDHQNIKAVARAFERVARLAGFRFLGNVEVGRDVALSELLDVYDAVVVATGAPVDRELGIPGEDLPGSLGAGAFVSWYNGHPDYRDLPVDLSCERAVVVGNGNVAADVARILLSPPDLLARTDIADHALETLRTSRVREVVIVGRRGPAEASFTNPELRELGAIPGCAVVVDPRELELEPASRSALARADDPTRRRNLETFSEFARRQGGHAERRLRFLFRRSPLRIVGDRRVAAVEVVRNTLVEDGGRVVALATERTESIACGFVVRAVGFRSEPLPELPFDAKRGIVPNDRGRVLDPASRAPLPGLYVAGWAKRGPTGVIGTNKQDAAETAAAVLEDLARQAPAESQAPADPVRSADRHRDPLDELGLRDRVVLIDYSGWLRIDAAERERGRAQGRPRVKFSDRRDLLRQALAGVEHHPVAQGHERR
ncbi:MAG: FAD-dependent oxidoreductase [Thermoleophilum sp.]|nr:FAD-dependent oxidoreductase [Thermoleophilum sp.]